MTIPAFRQQAHKLITTGQCDLPITTDNVARLVAEDESFTLALEQACEGDSRLLQMIRIKCAAALCRDFMEGEG
jgi:hypothetical protein